MSTASTSAVAGPDAPLRQPGGLVLKASLDQLTNKHMDPPVDSDDVAAKELLEDKFSIFYVDSDGSKGTVLVCGGTTLGEYMSALTKKLFAGLDITPDDADIRLALQNGKPLTSTMTGGDNMPLANYGIQKNSTIHVLGRLRGGMPFASHAKKMKWQTDKR